jgi:hypothetical protein
MPVTRIYADQIASSSVAHQTQSSAKLRWIGAITALIFLALAHQLWAALQGSANFDADEAILGLMALHTLKGDIPTYFYGQQYLGSLEAIIAAGAMALFGSSLLMFRLSAIALFAVFLVLHTILIRRLWNGRVALLSLLVLAFPAPLIRMWTYRPITGLAIIFVLGTALLLLVLSPTRWSLLRALLIGVLIGLGLWSHPMVGVYVLTIGALWGLQTPEWAAMYRAVGRWSERVLRINVRTLMPFLLFGVAGLGVIAFFSDACTPAQAVAVAQTVAKLALAIVGVALAATACALSQHRAQLLWGGVCLAAGTALGSAPVWRAWLLFGVAPAANVQPSCVTEATPRLELLTTNLLPSVWGVRSIEFISSRSGWAMLWIVALIIPVAALVYAAWSERRALRSLLTAAPLRPLERRVLIIGLLFAVPSALALLSSNTLNEASVRYLMVPWQASSVIIALLLDRLLASARLLGLAVLGFWLGFVGVSNVVDVRIGASPFSVAFTPPNVGALTGYLQQHNVQGGYTDYWIAYPLDFLTHESLTFAPFNHLDRYEPYTQRVADLPVQAYVFLSNTIPDDLATAEALRDELRNRPDLFMFTEVIDGLEGDQVIERRRINNLDVWLIRNSGS